MTKSFAESSLFSSSSIKTEAPDFMRYLRERLDLQKQASEPQSRMVAKDILTHLHDQNIEKFLSFMSSQVQFRFGSQRAQGIASFKEALVKLFEKISKLHHHIHREQHLGAQVLVTGEVHLTLKAGEPITTPFCNVWKIDSNGYIDEYFVYCDMMKSSSTNSW